MKKTIHFSCLEGNDLFNILQNQENLIVFRHNSPLSAVQAADSGSAVLILSTEYPQKRVNIPQNFFEFVHEKNLKAYLEYPSFLPDIKLEKTHTATVERAVISSSFFDGFPDTLQILHINGLNYIPVQVETCHIVSARVAGFDNAVFGLPENSSPLLFELPNYPIMVSTTCLSQFVTGRYAPQFAWANIWRKLLTHLLPETPITELNWQPVFHPAYGKTEILPENYQNKSIQSGIEWYFKSKMIAHASSETLTKKMISEGNGRMMWDASIPIGTGTCGAYECIFSEIDENGNQPIGIAKRGDCISETAMAFACAGSLFDNQEYLDIAKNLLDFYLFHSSATKNEYANPDHAAYGLIPWGISNYAWYKASYGDDNARFLLGAFITSALTHDKSWDEALMKSLIALLRTTGKNGFRGGRIDLPELKENGWKYYYDRDITNISPHFEAYLWACMLWAYDKTGDPVFLERTRNAIHTTMDAYPEGWQWTNGLAQEKARMILPLAWLVRIEDTPENRAMLLTVVNDLLELQDECGAIREELGDLTKGKYPPPQTNESYGTAEAPLIANNGDPVSDLLYTTNFALFGLYEAYHASKDSKIKDACDQLIEFLCRIQVVSKELAEIDGGWMRAFDYQRYEHWGSNADHGWGAWSIESGWTQGWIISILALREHGISIWDLTKNSNVNHYYEPLRNKMLRNASPPLLTLTNPKRKCNKNGKSNTNQLISV